MSGAEVRIRKEGNKVILEPLDATWSSLLASLSEFPEDFMTNGREQPEMQERESF